MSYQTFHYGPAARTAFPPPLDSGVAGREFQNRGSSQDKEVAITLRFDITLPTDPVPSAIPHQKRNPQKKNCEYSGIYGLSASNKDIVVKEPVRGVHCSRYRAKSVGCGGHKTSSAYLDGRSQDGLQLAKGRDKRALGPWLYPHAYQAQDFPLAVHTVTDGPVTADIVEIRKVQIEGGRLVTHDKLNTNFGSSEGEEMNDVVTRRHYTGLHASPNSQVESIVWCIMGQIF
ncbi:hypothetical protein BJV77DRAFT_963278 [Russula vinacea]|nr:hypothetical protein BJV77DRAFT_963278 [Russula vinacea]